MGFEQLAAEVVSYGLERSVAFAVVFVVSGVVWLATKKWQSSHVGSLWFLLPLVVLVVPVERWIPNPWAGVNPIESAALSVLPQAMEIALVNPATEGFLDFSGWQGTGATSNAAVANPTSQALLSDLAGADAPGATLPSWQILVLFTWLLCLAAYLVRLARAQRVIPNLLAEATVLDDAHLPIKSSALRRLAGVQSAVTIVESPEFESPSLWTGALPKSLKKNAPVIILPEGLASRLSPRELQWVLLHELAHLARRDHRTELAQRILGAAFFFHPLVWLTNRIARGYREMACDDAALARCPKVDHKRCARALFEVVAHASALAQQPRAHKTTHAMASLFHSKHLTRRRIMRLTEINRPLARGLRLSALVPILLVSSAALAAARFPAIAPQEPFLDDVTDFEVMDHHEVPPSNIASARKAVVSATDWLLATQLEDGSWIHAAAKEAESSEPTEPGIAGWAKDLEHLGSTVDSELEYEPYHSTIALTGLGLQALCRRAVYEPTNSDLLDGIHDAIFFLLDQQDPDTGIYGESSWTTMVSQALATEAIAKAIMMDKKQDLKIGMTDAFTASLKLSVSMLERARNPYGAWRYDVVPRGDNDTRITGYVMLALVAAYDAGVHADPEAFASGMNYLMILEDETSGRTHYQHEAEFAFRIKSRQASHPAEYGEVPTAMHMRLRNAAGFEQVPTGGMVKALRILGNQTPQFNQADGQIDYTYWWHGTEALLSSDERGEVWRHWRGDLLDSLIMNQALSAPNRGTWPTVDAWSAPGMEAYTTATCALALYSLIDAE